MLADLFSIFGRRKSLLDQRRSNQRIDFFCQGLRANTQPGLSCLILGNGGTRRQISLSLPICSLFQLGKLGDSKFKRGYASCFDPCKMRNLLHVLSRMVVEDARTTPPLNMQLRLNPFHIVVSEVSHTRELTVLAFAYRGYAFVLKKTETEYAQYHLVLSRYGYNEDGVITRRDVALLCGEESCFDKTNCTRFTPISLEFTPRAAIMDDDTLIVILSREVHYDTLLHSMCTFGMRGSFVAFDKVADCHPSMEVRFFVCLVPQGLGSQRSVWTNLLKRS